MELLILFIGITSGAAAGVIVCAVLLTAARPAPRNERRHNLGRLLVVSHPDWRNQ